MNVNAVIAGLALVTALGTGSVAQASPFESRWDGKPQALSHYNRHDDYRRYDRHERLGRVVDVEPIWPKRSRECRVESGRRDRDEARVIGALAGATVGNLIGREHDNALAGTIAGALIGSAGAEIIVRHDDDRYRGKECVPGHKLKYHQQPVAYRVRYIYRGQVYTTRTQNHPGRFIEIDQHYGRRG